MEGKVDQQERRAIFDIDNFVKCRSTRLEQQFLKITLLFFVSKRN